MLQNEKAMAELRRLRTQAEEEGLNLFEYAIRTTVNTPGITSIILGLKRSEQLEQTLHALQ